MNIEYDKVAHLYDEYLFFPHEKIYFNNFIQFIDYNFIKSKKQNILDIACGTGNALTFFENKNNCTGIDLSSKMLDIARTKFKNVDFHKLDFRNFNLNKKYDLILCLFDSLNHTEDIIPVFNSVKKHLNKNSIFVFDYYTQFGLDECIKHNNDILTVKNINNGTYRWNICLDKTIASITEYVVPIAKLIESLNSLFKIELFDQNFNPVGLFDITTDKQVAQNQIERLIVVASLK